MSAHTIAENDDQAMDILSGWATGNHAGDVAEWIAEHRVDTLPQSVVNGIAAVSPVWWLAPDDGPSLAVTEHAQADYGGGSEAADWFELSDGDVYGIDTLHNLYHVPRSHIDDMPSVTAYAAISDSD